MKKVKAPFILLLFFLLLLGCKPSFVRKWTLQYEVVNLLPEPVSYSVIYTDGNGKTKSFGPISEAIWQSEVYEDIPSGKLVSIEVLVKSGLNDLEVKILRDGGIHQNGYLKHPDSKIIVEGKL